MKTIFSSREEVTEEIRAQKVRLNLKWAKVADEFGQSKEWTTAACLGQMQMNEAETDKVQIFKLAPEAKLWLQKAPNRGGTQIGQSQTNLDPLIYRFQEVINVFGPALKELIHEEFGDGIMSAIDFKIDVQREYNEQDGDRVKMIWSGKFLPYKRF